MWESCNFYPEAEFEVLIDKSLIKIVDRDRIWMHGQLRDLGRDVVRQENITNPEGRSRLWLHEMALDMGRARKVRTNAKSAFFYRKKLEGIHVPCFKSSACVLMHVLTNFWFILSGHR